MISVIIPIYNVEAYLRRCVDSVLRQTYGELEIILVDDGSPDGCGAICDEYAEKDRRVKVIHQENRGLSGARNAGLKLASGEFVAFLDSDDYIDPDMYEKLRKVLLEQDADIAECGYRWVKKDVTYDRENTGKVDVYTNLQALEKLYFGDQMFGGLSIVAWNKLYRRELVRAIGFVEGLNHEDVVFTPQALYAARRVAKLNLNLHNFFFSPNSISRGAFRLKKLDAIEARRQSMAFLREKGLDRYYALVESTYFSALYDGWYNCRKGRKDPAFREMEEKLAAELKAQYPAMLKNPHEQGNLWRHRLFHASPVCYYWALDIKRRVKGK